METIISVIIPCYNQAQYLPAALASVLNQTYQYWEAIIVNDGSSDNTEEVALSWVNKDPRIKYYATINQGLPKTRNFAIAKAKGKFILPLDSDNQLISDFMEAAIAVFDKNNSVGVVHGDAHFFGMKDWHWQIEEFNYSKMLVDNYIDACAIYKKTLWEIVGGYDEYLPHNGLEDWDFWLALGRENTTFYHLHKVTFKYFVADNSMIKSFTERMAKDTRYYMMIKYAEQYREHYHKFYIENNSLKSQINNKKYVIDLFFKTFLGFEIFKSSCK